VSYDINGHNSRQDILKEIERRLRIRETQKTKTSILAHPRKPQRGSKRVRQPKRS